MDMLSFNTDLTDVSYSNNKDILSVFKNTKEKELTIQQGMSVKEISEIVSEKIIDVVKKQFEATKIKIENQGSK
jgi:serine/threonine protein phosphatase PrpC